MEEDERSASEGEEKVGFEVVGGRGRGRWHGLVSIAALVRAETHVKLEGSAATLVSEDRGIA